MITVMKVRINQIITFNNLRYQSDFTFSITFIVLIFPFKIYLLYFKLWWTHLSLKKAIWKTSFSNLYFTINTGMKNVIRWWKINFAPSTKQPFDLMLTKVYDTMWCH